MNKKYLAAVVVIIVVVVGAAAYWMTQGPKQASELKVWTWAGYDLQTMGEYGIWDDFVAAHPDLKVSVTNFPDEESALARVAVGDRFDVSNYGGYRTHLIRYLELGALEPLDLNLIPNYQDVHPFFKDLTEEVGSKDGKLYAIITDMGMTSILYRRDLIQAAGLPEPDSWSVLWDSRYAEVGIAMYDAPSEIGGPIFDALFTVDDFKNPTDAQLAAWKDAVTKAFSQAKIIYDDQYELYDSLKSGEVAIATMWTEVYAMGLEDGLDVVYLGLTPGHDYRQGEALFIWPYCMNVGQGAKERGTYELAHDYINAFLDPRLGQFLTNVYYYASTNTKAWQIADPEIVHLLGLDNPDSLLSKGVFYNWEHPDPDIWDKYFEAWTEAKTAAGVG